VQLFSAAIIASLATTAISAQSFASDATNQVNGTLSAGPATQIPSADNLQLPRWEYGPFLNGGFGVADRSDYHFFSVGAQIGRQITPVIHAGPFTGRFELAANVMPLWQAYTPPPHTEILTLNGVNYAENVGGGTFTGFSITPVIFRWNFGPGERKFTPWFQAAGGFIYTTHKFPPDILVPEGTPGGTSVFNFSPQGGLGFHYFTQRRRSIDFGFNAVHISSASLGDKNPGVNASLQMQLGYTWWK
jgi:hypothetical protein